MKRGIGMFVGWKERLFILTSKQLVYFEAGRLSALKGSLPLVRLRGLASACSPQRLRLRGVRRDAELGRVVEAAVEASS